MFQLFVCSLSFFCIVSYFTYIVPTSQMHQHIRRELLFVRVARIADEVLDNRALYWVGIGLVLGNDSFGKPYVGVGRVECLASIGEAPAKVAAKGIVDGLVQELFPDQFAVI